MSERIVTIDGPAGAGKTTVARLVAEQTGLPLLLSGRLYRAIAYGLLKRSVDLHDETAVDAALPDLPVALTNRGQVSYDGIVAGEELAAEDIGEAASVAGRYAAMRAYAKDMQVNFGAEHGCVIEGRTTGVHIFPDADLKIWLTADLAERMHRVAAERGDAAAEQMRLRDELDRTRQLEPMRPAEDAIEIDSTRLGVNEVVDKIIALYENR